MRHMADMFEAPDLPRDPMRKPKTPVLAGL
jgi:hypothetical protein